MCVCSKVNKVKKNKRTQTDTHFVTHTLLCLTLENGNILNLQE